MSVYAALESCRLRGQAAVLVTIAQVDGSAPRGVGTRLLVTTTDVTGTIGGGALEHAALEHAQQLLQDDVTTACVQVREWALGKALSQCCGGRVSLVFDRIPGCNFCIEVFGAGHVAQQIATVLRQLPCIARFHDQRETWLARLNADVNQGNGFCPTPDIDLGPASVVEPGPGVVHASLHDENVHAEVDACHPGAFFLVMTHSHERDLEVVEAVLTRDDAAFCGLIASRSKARAFRSRLSRKGFTESELAGLSAPLGQKVRTGNTPMEVAIAAISDVLDARTAARAVACASPALSSDKDDDVDLFVSANEELSSEQK